MSFGPRMQLRVGELDIQLAPLTREAMSEFVADGGMQDHMVTRYMMRRAAPVLEDEHEWYERVRSEKDSLVWGIWVVGTDGSKILIGTSSLHNISGEHFRIATSGSMIFRQEYWRRGIAKHAHKARTWYGFRQMGLSVIRSAVVQDNIGSSKALQGSGYEVCATKRNFVFVDGKFLHEDELECVNPDPLFWDRWWGEDEVPANYQAARNRTLDALAWAEAEVKLL